MTDITKHLTKSVNLEKLSDDLKEALPVLGGITINGFERPVRLPDSAPGVEYTLSPAPKVTSTKSERGVKTEHVSQPGEIVFTFERDLVGAENGTLNRVLADHDSTTRTPNQARFEQRVVDVAELRDVLAFQRNIGQPELHKMLSVLLSKH